jgi:hypothetical protein
MMTKVKMREDVELRVEETEGSLTFCINKQATTKAKQKPLHECTSNSHALQMDPISVQLP